MCERLIEEQTLRDYFGPNVPLPFGYYPRHVLRRMASEMILAQGAYLDRQQRAEKQRQEAMDRWQHRGMKWRPFGSTDAEEFVPWNTPFPNPPTSQLGVDATGLPIPPGIAMATGAIAHPMFSAFPSPAGTRGQHEHLPARILQHVDPYQFATRRQEAVAISRSLPPGITIRQPRRPSLTPPDKTPRIKHDSNSKEH